MGGPRIGDAGGGAETTRRSARLEQLKARLPRYLLIGFLAITSLVGLREIVLPEPTPPVPPAPDVSVDQAAEDYAQRFARAYLSFDAARPEARERALYPLVPSELDVDAGFAAQRGSQTIEWTQVAQNQRAAAGGRVIVVTAAIAESAVLVHLAVPISRLGDGSLQLGGYPSLVGPPAIETEAALPDREEVENADVVATARRVVENYLAGDERLLKADLADDAAVSLPPRTYELTGLSDVVWTDGPRNSEGLLITVEARDEVDSSYRLTYELGIEREAGRPVVSFVETVPTDS